MDNGNSERSEKITWHCSQCGNWELSTEHEEPPGCAAGHGDMVNQFAVSDKPMTKTERSNWVPY